MIADKHSAKQVYLSIILIPLLVLHMNVRRINIDTNV
jgi:hypothetical protein